MRGKGTFRILPGCRRWSPVALAALALVSYLMGDHLHLALEHHHWCPIGGEPVHHTDRNASCEDEEHSHSSGHKPHPASDHFQQPTLRAIPQFAQAPAAILPSPQAPLPPIRTADVFPARSDHPPDLLRASPQRARAPPLA